MFLETGTLVFLSLAVLIWRLPHKTMLWFFGHPIWLEIPFGIAAYVLHYGTFSGMMAAATAAILCFAFTQAGRFIVGYIHNNKYTPGILEIKF